MLHSMSQSPSTQAPPDTQLPQACPRCLTIINAQMIPCLQKFQTYVSALRGMIQELGQQLANHNAAMQIKMHALEGLIMSCIARQTTTVPGQHMECMELVAVIQKLEEENEHCHTSMKKKLAAQEKFVRDLEELSDNGIKLHKKFMTVGAMDCASGRHLYDSRVWPMLRR